MSGLEQFVNSVCTLSSQGNYRELCDTISKSSEVLIIGGAHLDNVLEALNLQQHSLAYQAVLVAKFHLPAPTSGPESRITLTEEFITNCIGEQVRHQPEIFAELCHLFTARLIELGQPMRGVPLMLKAIQKVQLEHTQLTSVHADLCQLCLLAKCFKPVLPILDNDITSINQEGSQFDAKYFLLYYYYGGMIYTAMKNLDRALYFFEVVVTTPALAVSHIMLEAYKKYILVSLILHGKVLCIPKYTSQVVGRFIKPLSQPYHDLAACYTTNSSEEVCIVVNKYQETFIRDKNMGLVKQVVSYLYKKNIQRLTKTFLTLSLTDVASRVQLPGPADAEKYILNMIEDGDIFATINQRDGMVIFHDAPEKYASPGTLRKLEKCMADSAALARRIQAMEEEILKNPVYVKKAAGIAEQDAASSTPSASYVI